MQATIAEQAGASDPSSQSTGRSAISESSVDSEGGMDNAEYPGTPVAAFGVDGVDAPRDDFMACKSPISPREAVVELKSDRSSFVSLKNILLNQQQWRTTSEGYHNLFEFGELHVLFRVVVHQWCVIYRDAPKNACQLPS